MADPGRLLEGYVAAYNSGDPERMLACYHDDVHFVVGGSVDLSGRDELRPVIEWDAALHIRMSVSEVRLTATAANFRLSERNDWFRLAGLEEAVYEPAWLRFRDGLVVELHAEQDRDNRDRFLPIWHEVMMWMREMHPVALRDLMPGGRFSYGAEQARRWLALLEERAAG